MYKVGQYVVIDSTKEIKTISEIERFDDDVVIYTNDGCAYGIRECRTIHEAYDNEVNKLLEKWKI
jgi:uncharacterized protein YutD